MTVNWHSSVRVLEEYVVLIKFVHVLGGMYIWEFVLNLDFEYSLLTRKRKLTWTYPLYLGCRWSPLFLLTVEFIGFDTPGEINCQVLVVMTFVFTYLSLLFASALIALRVAALWEHNKIIVAVVFTSWLVNLAIYVYSTVISHILLLILMLVGLFRWKETPGSSGVLQIMHAQGLAWVLVVAIAEVPPAVFIALDLNDPMNLMFQALGLTIMSIGASRVHRGLINHLTAKGPLFAAAIEGQLTKPQSSSSMYSQQNMVC